VRIITAALLLLLTSSLACGAPPKPRPLAGNGILTIASPIANAPDKLPALILYQEPGIGRFAEVEISDLPSLTPILQSTSGKALLAVTRTKDGWAKVIYEESGSEAWLAIDRHWRHEQWANYLRGREIRVLNGLRKEYLQLRATPAPRAQALESLSRQKSLRVIEVQENWALVLVELQSSGWLRWRDDDGRFLVSIE